MNKSYLHKSWAGGFFGAALLLGSASAGGLKLHDNLTVNGYADASYVDTNVDGSSTADTKTMALRQYELDFHYDSGKGLMARGDVQGAPATTGAAAAVTVEQAYIGYMAESGANVRVGKFLSKLGYEGREPWDLLQVTNSVASMVDPGYQNGVGVGYKAKMFSLYGAVLDGAWSADGDADTSSFELQAMLTPLPAWTFALGYATEEYKPVALASRDQSYFNFWAQYAHNNWTLAAEWNGVQDWGSKNNDGDGYLLTAHYDFNARVGLSVRWSVLQVENSLSVKTTDMSEFSICPTYKFMENWIGRLEYQANTNDLPTGKDSTVIAAETVLSF